jgi:hypothetical protein
VVVGDDDDGAAAADDDDDDRVQIILDIGVGLHAPELEVVVAAKSAVTSLPVCVKNIFFEVREGSHPRRLTSGLFGVAGLDPYSVTSGLELLNPNLAILTP